jgi:hypothetical protein
MGPHNNFYDMNGKPTQPPEQPVDPKDPDQPNIGDPVEPTDPEDPIQEPVKSNNRSRNRYDPNDMLNYIRLPGREHIH